MAVHLGCGRYPNITYCFHWFVSLPFLEATERETSARVFIKFFTIMLFISSGIKEMIDGTPISDNFVKTYASSFKYDVNGVAEWPSLAINFTTKTQYLFRINKGALDVYDNKKINKFVPLKDRPIPFENMIYIGDGETDIPCFSLVRNLGGHSIAVYKPNTRGAKARAEKLIDDGRVNFVAPADYSNKGYIDTIVKTVLDKIDSDSKLIFIGKQ
jgi:hypothetical protein